MTISLFTGFDVEILCDVIDVIHGQLTFICKYFDVSSRTSKFLLNAINRSSSHINYFGKRFSVWERSLKGNSDDILLISVAFSVVEIKIFF